MVGDFNAAARQLVPVNELRTSGLDLQIKINPAATEPGRQPFNTDLTRDMLPSLQRLLDDVNTEVHAVEQQRLGHEDVRVKITEARADRIAQNADLERKIEALEARYRLRKAEYDEAHRGKLTSIEAMQHEVSHLHEQLASQAAESTRQREAVEIEYENVQNQLRAERDAISDIVTEMAETVVSHKQHVQDCISVYRDAVAQCA